MTYKLGDIVKMLFTDRKSFGSLTDEDKQKWGFIVNRMLSKKYPEYAQKLNVRGGDFTMVLNLWWLYLGYQPKGYNPWIWPVGGKKESKLDKKTIELFQKHFPWISVSDIEFMSKWYKDEFESELKYYKKLEEDYG